MNKRLYLFLILVPLLIYSCKTVKTDRARLRKAKPAILEASMKENRIDFETLTARARINTKSPSGSNSFSAQVRIQKDSLIWLSLSPGLGIELARAMISPDSVKLIDRINGEYVETTYEELTKRYNINLSFVEFQDLFVGNSYNINTDKSTSKLDSTLYLLIKETASEHLKIWFEPNGYLVSKMDVRDKVNHQSLVIQYDEYKKTQGRHFPYKRNVEVTKMETFQARMHFSNVKFDEAISFPFKVPDKYKK